MTPAPARRRHVHEADVVRVLTFAAVIGVHTVAQTNGNSSVGANGLVMLLHFTREAFFVLTGFVLTHQYFGRPYRVGRFWSRRFLTVGVPYLVWTVIYAGLQWYQGPRTMSFHHWLVQLGFYVVHGDAWFHLYFLVVSLQIYLLYPLIAALIRATAGRHGLLLALSAAVQIALFSLLTYGKPHAGFMGWYAGESTILIATYQFYVLLGAVAAAHLDDLVAWVSRHPRWIIAGWVSTGVAAELWYLVATRHQLAADAAGVLQPIMLPWSVATVAGLFALGLLWSRHRRPGSTLDRIIAVASDRSFGIYLCHPAVLWVILWSGDRWLGHQLRGPWLALTAYACTVVGSVLVTDVLRHAPGSLALTGRPRLALTGRPRRGLTGRPRWARPRAELAAGPPASPDRVSPPARSPLVDRSVLSDRSSSTGKEDTNARDRLDPARSG